MVFLLIILITNGVYAIQINEIEPNPQGEDSGFEWIELYSEQTISLNGYFIDHEGRGNPINLSGEFSGFFTIDLQNQWLRNSNETVYLKLNNDVIQTVGPFTDSKNNDLSYTFCNGEWLFVHPSKNSANTCESENNEAIQEEKNEENKKEEIIEDKPILKENLTIEIKNETIQNLNYRKKISLKNNNYENYEITRTYKTRIGVVYFFIGFCVFLIVLISLKKI